MEHVIQVEMRNDTTHTLTWLYATLKANLGMVLLHKDDPRPWTVVHAYSITAEATGAVHTDWKFAGCGEPSRKETELHKRTSRNIDVICFTE